MKMQGRTPFSLAMDLKASIPESPGRLMSMTEKETFRDKPISTASIPELAGKTVNPSERKKEARLSRRGSSSSARRRDKGGRHIFL